MLHHILGKNIVEISNLTYLKRNKNDNRLSLKGK